MAPLYGLRASGTAFGEYASSLVEFLRSSENRVSGTAPYRVFHVVFKSATRGADDVVVITVHYRRRFEGSGKGGKERRKGGKKGGKGGEVLEEARGRLVVVLSAVRDSSGRKSSVAEREFTCLPLLLTKGPFSMARSVIEWLETSFDTSVVPLALASFQLSGLLSAWVRHIVLTDPAESAPKTRGRAAKSQGSSKRPLELVFDFPPELAGLESLSYTVDYDSLMSLFRASRSALIQAKLDADVPVDRDPVTGDALLDHEEQAALAGTIVDALFIQFESVFGISLSRVSLTQISSPLAMIAQGKLKLVNPHPDNVRFVIDSLHPVLFPEHAAAQQQ